jgi:NADPH:quinone reductase-like Zn-dependent oxidoreductase
VPWEVAGSLFIVGTTAHVAVHAVGVHAGDVVVVSGAAGGVGSAAVQLARNAGAKVIGLAGESNHEWLRAHGVIPVMYGDGVEARVRAASGGRVDALIDTHGGGYVELGLALGVAPERIDTIIDWAAAEKYHVKTAGNAEGACAELMAELADLVAKGKLEIPIARVYRLAEVREAFRELEKRHTRGKIVLRP